MACRDTQPALNSILSIFSQTVSVFFCLNYLVFKTFTNSMYLISIPAKVAYTGGSKLTRTNLEG